MKIEFTVKDPDIIRIIERQKKITEDRFGEKKTNSEIAEALFNTGALRRVAARKYANANKPKAKKPAPKKVKPAKKAAKPSKPKAPKKVKVASQKAGEAPAAPTSPPPAENLD